MVDAFRAVGREHHVLDLADLEGVLAAVLLEGVDGVRDTYENEPCLFITEEGEEVL